MKKLNLILFSLILFSKTFASAGEFIHGKLRIIDGDTIAINNQKIRLFGIDAPEIRQICKDKFLRDYNCGVKSKNALERAVSEKLTKAKSLTIKQRPNDKVWCISKEKDRYKRILGICAVDRIDLAGPHLNFTLNAWMVKFGNAVAYKRYSSFFLEFEEEAKLNKRGIWQGKFERPEQWRRKNK